MLIKTKHFGEIEFNDKDTYFFPEGIPGFLEYKKYILIENPSEASPFKWLQSVEEGDLAFAVVDPFSIMQDYEVDIPDDDIEELEIKDIGEVILLAIVVVPEDIKKISVNLLAPIVINTRKKFAKQVTLYEKKYSVRHYIFDLLNSNGGAANASVNKK